MRHTPIANFPASAAHSGVRDARAHHGRALPLAKATRWWKPDLGMLPLHALVIASAVLLTIQWEPVLGTWPLLTVLACPLLHLIDRREEDDARDIAK